MTPPTPPTPATGPTQAALAALRTQHQDTPAAVHTPTTHRTYTCPSPTNQPHTCNRTLTIPEAEKLAQHLRRLGLDAIVLAYGIPWAR